MKISALLFSAMDTGRASAMGIILCRYRLMEPTELGRHLQGSLMMAQ